MIIQGSQEFLSEKAAWLLYKALQVFIKTKNCAVLAVPGGRSVTAIYKNLKKFDLPWSKVHVFLLDERLVPDDHPESNYRLVCEHLADESNLEMIHQFTFDPADPQQGVLAYGEELQRCGGAFDIALVSCGEDGHIASLFPNHHSVENRDRGFILIEDAPKLPPARMSASYELIRNADTGLVLFFGSSKQSALHNFFNIHLSDVECPAKVMTKLSRYYLLTDQEVETP